MNICEGAINLVRTLNEEIYDQYDHLEIKVLDSFSIAFTFETDGSVEVIKFLGMQIWNSNNDNIHPNDVEGEGDLKKFVRAEANKLLSGVKSINVF